MTRDELRTSLTATTRAPAPLPVDLETRALRMLTDDQAMQSFIRWRTGMPDTVPADSLRDEHSVAQYVSAIFNRVPE